MTKDFNDLPKEYADRLRNSPLNKKTEEGNKIIEEDKTYLTTEQKLKLVKLVEQEFVDHPQAILDQDNSQYLKLVAYMLGQIKASKK